MNLRVLCLAVLVIAACSKPEDSKKAAPATTTASTAAAPPPPSKVDAAGQKMLVDARRIAEVVKTGDCKVLVAEIAKLDTAPKTLTKAEYMELEQKYGKQLEEILAPMKVAMTKCQDDPALQVQNAKYGEEFGVKMLDLAQRIGDAATASKGDCAQLGKRLKPLGPEMKALLSHAPQREGEKVFTDKYLPQVLKVEEPAGAAMKKCASNADVKAFAAAVGS